MKRFVTLILLTLFTITAGCSGSLRQSLDGDEGKLRVVTTFAPLYSMTVNVAGEAATVDNIVPIGASEHTYEAKPSDVKKIARADLITKNGVGLERFLEGLIKSAARDDVKVIDTSRSIKILGQEKHRVLDPETKEEDEDSGDPHLWLSPKNAMRQVRNIRDALIDADPGNAEIYRSNASNYIERLEELDSEIKNKLAGAPRKRYMVFHNAYQYFEKEYGLNNEAAIEEFPGKEPSARYLRNLIDLIKKDRVGVIFTEPQFSPKVVDLLKQEHGVYVGVLDPIGSEISKDGYEKMMRGNLDSFIKAFAESSGE